MLVNRSCTALIHPCKRHDEGVDRAWKIKVIRKLAGSWTITGIRWIQRKPVQNSFKQQGKEKTEQEHRDVNVLGHVGLCADQQHAQMKCCLKIKAKPVHPMKL